MKQLSLFGRGETKGNCLPFLPFLGVEWGKGRREGEREYGLGEKKTEEDSLETWVPFPLCSSASFSASSVWKEEWNGGARSTG